MGVMQALWRKTTTEAKEMLQSHCCSSSDICAQPIAHNQRSLLGEKMNSSEKRTIAYSDFC